MAFEEREITPEDIKWLKKLPIAYARESGYGKYLVEDREENAVMVQNFGQGRMTREGKYISEIPIIGTLVWDGLPIYLESYFDRYLIPPNIYVGPRGMVYSVSRIQVSCREFHEAKKKIPNSKRIKQKIKEAFFARQSHSRVLEDENGEDVKDENGNYVRITEPYEKIEMLYMAEPEFF